MSDREEDAPGAGERAGGAEDRHHHHPDGASIAENASPTKREALIGDKAAALDFLQRWRPGGPWVLSAIEVDPPKKNAPVPTVTFTDPGEAARWIDAHAGGRWNIYFTVNVTRGPVSKKPTKRDMAAATGFHVDVDPRVPDGGWPKERPTPERLAELAAHGEAERRRIRRMAEDWEVDGRKLPFPRPTAVIDSGGGYQFFWQLGEELPLPGEPGDEERHLPVEERNLKIEGVLGGDSCHNIERIMRLPGTVNWPGEGKRRKGRTARLVRVVEADWSRVYGPDDFERLPKKAGTAAPAQVKLSASLPQVELGDLPAGVSDRTKMLIANGDDPDDPTRYPSRSEALFAVLCELVRAGVDDDTMAALILDPDNGISAHVLEQPRTQQYVARQIGRARDEAVDPALRELNAAHVVIESMGASAKCRIMERLPTPDGRGVVAFQSFEDFRNRYMHRFVVVGQDKDKNDVKMPLGKWWLQNPARRQHKTLIFLPGGGEILEGDQFNLWQGFGVQPKAGDWSLMQAHIRDVLAGGDPEAADYIVRWAAYAVQHPDRPAEAALVFRGDLGTGKGAFGRAMLRIFGRHGLRTQGAAVLDSRFNVHLRDCCLLFADEVDWDSRRSSSQLKGMVTEESLFIEPKGVDATNQPNYLHIIIASNSDWVIPAAPGERRFAAFRVSSDRKDDKAYFNALFAEMDGGGLAAMLHDLLAMDLTGWHPRWNIPQTGELSAQKLAGLTGADAIAREVLMGAVGAGLEKPIKGADWAVMVRPLILWAIDNRIVSSDPGERRMTDALKRMGCKRRKLTFQNAGQRWAWALPPLAEARATWAEDLGLTVEWPDEEDWSGFPG